MHSIPLSHLDLKSSPLRYLLHVSIPFIFKSQIPIYIFTEHTSPPKHTQPSIHLNTNLPPPPFRRRKSKHTVDASGPKCQSVENIWCCEVFIVSPPPLLFPAPRPLFFPQGQKHKQTWLLADSLWRRPRRAKKKKKKIPPDGGRPYGRRCTRPNFHRRPY